MATMATATVPQIATHRVERAQRGVLSWLTTTDHKKIGILYMVPQLQGAGLTLATILPGQLLAESVARRRGYDPDAPPGLHKVTLTR